MGAWGVGTFQNDAALDWLDAFAEQGPSFVTQTLSAVVSAADDAYLESEDCAGALAAAELIAAVHSGRHDRLNGGDEEKSAAQRVEASVSNVALARKAVERVASKSELQELWDEGDSGKWRADLAELLRRLK